jgi:hypothetical protein
VLGEQRRGHLPALRQHSDGADQVVELADIEGPAVATASPDC